MICEVVSQLKVRNDLSELRLRDRCTQSITRGENKQRGIFMNDSHKYPELLSQFRDTFVTSNVNV